MGFEFGIFLGSLEHPGFANTLTVCIDDGCLPRGVTHVYLRRAVRLYRCIDARRSLCLCGGFHCEESSIILLFVFCQVMVGITFDRN